MKKLPASLLFIILVSFIVLFGCGKYERAANRMHRDWAIKSYQVNGADSLSLFTDSIGNIFHFWYDDKDYQDVLEIKSEKFNHGETNFGWYYYLGDDAKSIYVTHASGNNSTGPFRTGYKPVWEIIKLKKNEFSLKTTYNNKEYIIELE